ncbi:WLM domain-containing protein [Cladophialophora immunda]|nr:WLM domain-containing protein [Cladophialophora immunda]
MPLNTLRLNHQKSSHPNDRIVFIKPLPRPPSDQASYDLADTFLRAIAAQCLPLMKSHYLSVTTLEEYEPNPEFIGRNFNNGEIIQLVLQSKSGGWVPFNMVQMVMMHELAHNTHMNHGRDFWKTRNLYAEEMKGLWEKGYTGEGFWGSGRTLSDLGTVMGSNVLRSEELEGLPLCGGTYRSRKRKRKARTDKPELTWKEKRDRRIEKKFGKNGVTLGEDENVRLSLEINRKGPIGNKPRVAQSKRGRELRAAAALARFETNKKEVADLQNAAEEANEDVMDEDFYEDADASEEDAKDINGQRMLDGEGRGMIRVCDNEDTGDIDVQRELQELNTLDRYFKPFQTDAEFDGIQAKDPDSADKTSTRAMTATPESDTTERSQASREMDREKQQLQSTGTPIKVSCHLPDSESTRSNTKDAFPILKLRQTKTVVPNLESAQATQNPA